MSNDGRPVALELPCEGGLTALGKVIAWTGGKGLGTGSNRHSSLQSEGFSMGQRSVTGSDCVVPWLHHHAL
jgi:hypothetical protein